MKGLAITYKGIEDICANEIEELIKAKTEIKEGCVVFEFTKLEELALLCYKGQSVNKVLLLFNSFSIKSMDDLKAIEKIDFYELKLLKEKSFASRALIVENDLKTGEVESKVGEHILNKIKLKVDLDNPDIIIFTYIYRNNCYVGIDFSGDISKREYKIFSNPISLKGTIAYALVRIADYKKEETLVDPFCGSGEIVIESALFVCDFPVCFFDKRKFPFLKIVKDFNFEKIDKKISKMKTQIFCFDREHRFVKSAEKNAKIAGINKQTKFSRVDLGWLELKFKKKTVDKIVTNIPRS